MLSKVIRAGVTALAIGTAAVAVAGLITTVPAQAAVRSVVGKPLNEAKALAASGSYSAALARVSAAEAVPNLTPEEKSVISAMRQYIEVKSGTGALGTKAKFANDYNAKRYRDVIADGELLRKNGGLDGSSMQIIAQAYYLLGDYHGCSRYIMSNFGSGGGEEVLKLQMRCAYESQDNDSMRTALETLVARTNKPEYWGQLLNAAQSTKGLTDHQTLDIYRLRLLTNTITKADDYNLLAQLALQLGFAAEAQSVIEKGIAAKVLTGDRTTRLLTMAQKQAGANAAKNAAALAAANAAPNGDALVKLGEDAWGQGHYPDAIKLIQAGLQKGPTDKDNALIRLGVAYYSGGQKDQAVRSFEKADGDAKQKIIAHLWTIFARTH
ncbi:MAG TPA: tetratricopeptide repeat protein [Rhizomicrobium sp.]|jgi:tetratricopeptide (TPR) repeat protein|nr:tetratricopeptide repeat protein [Rhizomicrobium sp.]